MIQNTTPPPPNPYYPQLDDLIAKIKQTKSTAGTREHSLLVEHLETAHAYLRGAMPEECAVNLDLARQEASELSDEQLQRETNDLIERLQKSLPASSVKKH